MGLYRDTGNVMLIAGVVSIATSIFSLMILFSGFMMMYPSGPPSVEPYIISIATGIINLVILSVLAYLSFKLGGELDEGTIKAGAVLLILALFVSLAVNLYIYFAFQSIIEKINSGTMPPEEMMAVALRLAGLSFLSFALAIISYIVYGIGLRHVGDLLGLNDLKTAGLLVILGFIPLLFPIGLIIGGLALRKVE